MGSSGSDAGLLPQTSNSPHWSDLSLYIAGERRLIEKGDFLHLDTLFKRYLNSSDHRSTFVFYAL